MKTGFYLLIIGLIVFYSKANCQEAINLTQYTSGISIINPAYSGLTGRFTAQLISRNQWVGIEGAPKSHAIILNSPVPNYNFGLGAIIMYQQIGPVKEYHFNVNTAFHTKLTEKINISFGLKSIIGLYSSDYLGDAIIDQGDPYFQETPKTSSYINFGAGIYIYGKNFFIGYAANPLIKNRVRTTSDDNIGYYEINNQITHSLMGAFSIKAAEDFIIKPSLLFKSDKSLKPTFDFSMTTIYKDIFWFGTTYRSSKTVSLFTEIQVGEKLRVGYAYDFGISKDYALKAGSHELVCTFDIQLIKKKFITPRYF